MLKNFITLYQLERLIKTGQSRHDQVFTKCIRSDDEIERICKTCNNHLIKNERVPPCVIANGMYFPEKPFFFDLNELECPICSSVSISKKIFQVQWGDQLKVTVNIVLANMKSIVNMLPRLPDETGTIKVRLKRRLQYKSSAL